MIDYKIIATGSKGNAVIINHDILIECGVPFRALKDVYKDLRVVLLTHIHADHFNRATIKRLAFERPLLRWGVPDWLVAETVECGVRKQSIDVYMPNLYNNYSGLFCVVMKETPHDVRNCAWLIYAGNESVMYATDCNSLENITAKGLGLYLIEANYGEEELTERIRRKQEAGLYCHEWDVLKNHLSREKADDWLYRNMGPNSRYVYLHKHRDSA